MGNAGSVFSAALDLSFSAPSFPVLKLMDSSVVLAVMSTVDAVEGVGTEAWDNFPRFLGVVGCGHVLPAEFGSLTFGFCWFEAPSS